MIKKQYLHIFLGNYYIYRDRLSISVRLSTVRFKPNGFKSSILVNNYLQIVLLTMQSGVNNARNTEK